MGHQVLISEECQQKFGDLMGHRVQVKITETLKHSLHCTVLRDITPKNWLERTEKIENAAEPMGETTNHENSTIDTENDKNEDESCAPGGCCGGRCATKNKPESKEPTKNNKPEPIFQDSSNNKIWTTISITGAVLASLMVYQ